MYIRLMAPKTVCCFVVLLFTESFPRESLNVVISFLIILRESLGICIMSIVLFLNGGEQLKLWSMGAARLQGGSDFGFRVRFVDFVERVIQNLPGVEGKNAQQ